MIFKSTLFIATIQLRGFKTIAAIILLALLQAPTWAATMLATVDRNSIQLNELVTLTVEISEQVSGTPDFSVLEQSFEIVDTQRSQTSRLVNGTFSAKSVWVLSLLPKQTGYIIIPALTYRNIQSDPITIKVQKSSPQVTNTNKPVFVLASVDRKEAYVQEQINLTVQIFHKAKLYDGDLSKLDVKDAVVEQISDQKTYRTSIKGVGYGVYEINYIIYPQASGSLTIPAFVFDGNIATNRRNNSFFSPFTSQGKRVREVSSPINIEVKPKPANYPQGAPWLPAEDVTLEESWSPNPPQFAVGEPVTRSIIIKAKGQSSAAIPSLPDLSGKGYKVYPDKAQTEDKQTPDGIVGYHIESVAIVPTQPGTLTLPAIKLYCWDTDSDELKTSKLPERTIKVATGAAELAPPPRSPIQAPVAPDAASSLEVQTVENPIWKLLTFVFATLWVLTLAVCAYFYVRRPRIVKRKADPNTRPKPVSTKALTDKAVQACRSNEPTIAKECIIALAKSMSPMPVNSIGDVRKVLIHESVNTALYALEDALYKGDSTTWQGEHLATAIQLAMKEKQTDKKSSGEIPLAPLHPTT